MDDLWTVIKKLALLVAATVCFCLMVKSFFHMGRVAVFGVPVSGLAIGVLMRALWREL